MQGGEANGSDAPGHLWAARVLLEAYDWSSDVFGGRPNVPQPKAAEFLMAVGLRTGHPGALKAALRSLAVLPKSELADPVDGGFFERCEGPRWKGPYTRKTLAGNAALLQALASAGAWTGDAAMKGAARSTAEFIDRGLKSEEGDLWEGALSPDDEYYERLAHRRAQRGAPPSEGPATFMDACAATSAFVRAGVALDEPRWVARARIAGRTLSEWPEPRSPEEEAAWGNTIMDLFVATDEGAWGGWAEDSNYDDEGLVKRKLQGVPPGPARWEATLAAARWGVSLPPPPLPPAGSLDAVAMAGLCELVAREPQVWVGCHHGLGSDRPEPSLWQAAVAAAWAVGPPTWAATPPPGGNSRGLVFGFGLGPGAKESAPVADRSAIRRTLVELANLKEGI